MPGRAERLRIRDAGDQDGGPLATLRATYVEVEEPSTASEADLTTGSEQSDVLRIGDGREMCLSGQLAYALKLPSAATAAAGV